MKDTTKNSNSENNSQQLKFFLYQQPKFLLQTIFGFRAQDLGTFQGQ